MRLEKPVTTCGAPLFYMARSSPPFSLWNCRKASTGASPLLKNFVGPIKPPTGAMPTASGEIFVAFTAHPKIPNTFTVINLQENQRVVAHHNTAFTVHSPTKPISQGTALTAHCSTKPSSGTQPLQYTVLHKTQTLQYNVLLNLHHSTQRLHTLFY